jgi:manganese/zinc/iron transport system permease protein
VIEAVFRTTTTSSVSTAGMMAVVSGTLFLAAWCFSPRHGLLRQWYDRAHLRQRILSEDVLGVLYRLEELRPDVTPGADRASLAATLSVAPWRLWRALSRLTKRGWIEPGGQGVMLTDVGRTIARGLVRSHRLWESYLAKHFIVPDQRLHQLAEAAEHFVGPQVQQALAEELEQPLHDPHGSKIPPADHNTR